MIPTDVTGPVILNDENYLDYAKSAEELNFQSDDGVYNFKSLLGVLDDDNSGGLSISELQSPQFEDIGGYDVNSTIGQSVLKSLDEGTVARLEENGALDDGVLTSQEVFTARDLDGDGELTETEFESTRANMRDMYVEAGVDERFLQELDNIGAFDDNYVTNTESEQAQAAFNEIYGAGNDDESGSAGESGSTGSVSEPKSYDGLSYGMALLIMQLEEDAGKKMSRQAEAVAEVAAEAAEAARYNPNFGETVNLGLASFDAFVGIM